MDVVIKTIGVDLLNIKPGVRAALHILMPLPTDLFKILQEKWGRTAPTQHLIDAGASCLNGNVWISALYDLPPLYITSICDVVKTSCPEDWKRLSNSQFRSNNNVEKPYPDIVLFALFILKFKLDIS